ncbi:LOW QUALITY PROTEIN: hypothetical protein E2986_12926 [Frieseomelitta varia]|uniref:Uncharacterized protein n=1 Tax=Frieseomelitta varia TaxID=561572 RepID=A0A833VXN2_9HYME|nr:LOW QUALITY PROTEIN: hypothetical protein E2986_12926 [Frieseomelitta varia]
MDYLNDVILIFPAMLLTAVVSKFEFGFIPMSLGYLNSFTVDLSRSCLSLCVRGVKKITGDTFNYVCENKINTDLNLFYYFLLLQRILAMNKDSDLSGVPPKKSRVEVQSLPTRQYLDQTVVPILLQALSNLAKERPADPISFLAGYLLRNKSQYDNAFYHITFDGQITEKNIQQVYTTVFLNVLTFDYSFIKTFTNNEIYILRNISKLGRVYLCNVRLNKIIVFGGQMTEKNI